MQQTETLLDRIGRFLAARLEAESSGYKQLVRGESGHGEEPAHGKAESSH